MMICFFLLTKFFLVDNQQFRKNIQKNIKKYLHRINFLLYLCNVKFNQSHFKKGEKMKKYRLTDETIKFNGRTLHRIQALRSFNGVDEGDLGGFVESEYNLSHNGNCWIYDDAIVCDNAQVRLDAKVSDNAQVCEDAYVTVDAIVTGNAQITGNAYVSDNAQVREEAYVSGDAEVCGDAYVTGNAIITGDAKVVSNAIIKGKVMTTEDYEVLGTYGDNNRYVTINYAEKTIAAGCFYGDLEEFKKLVDKKYKGEGNYYELIEFLKSKGF